MVSRKNEPKITTVTATKRHSWHQTVSFTTTFGAIVNSYVRLPPMASMVPVEFDTHYGLDQDVAADLDFEIYLGFGDLDNLPDLSSFRERAIWSAIQIWRAIGTDAGPIQTITPELLDWLNPEQYFNIDLAARTRNVGLLVAGVGSASLTARLMGVLTYMVEYIEREWGDDNWTFNSPNEFHNGVSFEEYCSDDA